MNSEMADCGLVLVTLGVVTRGTFTAVNYPFTTGNCILVHVTDISQGKFP